MLVLHKGRPRMLRVWDVNKVQGWVRILEWDITWTGGISGLQGWMGIWDMTEKTHYSNFVPLNTAWVTYSFVNRECVGKQIELLIKCMSPITKNDNSWPEVLLFCDPQKYLPEWKRVKWLQFLYIYIKKKNLIFFSNLVIFVLWSNDCRWLLQTVLVTRVYTNNTGQHQLVLNGR